LIEHKLNCHLATQACVSNLFCIRLFGYAARGLHFKDEIVLE